MRRAALLSSAILGFLGCTRPEVEAYRLKPPPIAVVMTIPGDIPHGEEVRKEYAAALQAKLATRVVVVPEGVQGPPDVGRLEVTIKDVRRYRGGPDPATVGVATGITVGVLGAAAGNRYSAFDGFWWGFFAASHAAHARRAELDRLGYRPLDVTAVVRLRHAGEDPMHPRPLAEFDVGGDEVIDAMDPLTHREAEDEGRIREEEARAFARVVVGKLQEQFGWNAHGSPVFYLPPGPKATEPDRADPPPPPPPRADH